MVLPNKQALALSQAKAKAAIRVLIDSAFNFRQCIVNSMQPVCFAVSNIRTIAGNLFPQEQAICTRAHGIVYCPHPVAVNIYCCKSDERLVQQKLVN